MRPTSKISVCLTAISLSLLLLFCNSGRPEETRKAQPGIKELEQKRLALLQQVCEVAKKLFENARVPYSDLHAAERELFAARLAYADTRQDRIKACNEAIEDARHWQGIIQARKASARATEVEVLQALDFELQAQIARVKAEAKE